MHAIVEPNLALILFAPWFLIVGLLFWMYPRAPRPPARRAFDAGVLLLALMSSACAMSWAFGSADPGAGAIWKQVLAAALGYGVFIGVLGIAVKLRGRCLRSQPGRLGMVS